MPYDGYIHSGLAHNIFVQPSQHSLSWVVFFLQSFCQNLQIYKFILCAWHTTYLFSLPSVLYRGWVFLQSFCRNLQIYKYILCAWHTTYLFSQPQHSLSCAVFIWQSFCKKLQRYKYLDTFCVSAFSLMCSYVLQSCFEHSLPLLQC